VRSPDPTWYRLDDPALETLANVADRWARRMSTGCPPIAGSAAAIRAWLTGTVGERGVYRIGTVDGHRSSFGYRVGDR